MVRRRYIPLRTAHPGMILDQAIIDRAGRVLIARRTPLEDFHIEGLRKMGVGGIYIREGEEDPDQEVEKEEQSLPAALQKTYDKVKVRDPARVKISESVRKRVAQGVQYLYQDTNSADFTNASRSITDDLLKAIEDNDAVAVDIGALQVSDEYTFKHSVDVATMAMIVARKYGLNDNQVYQIGIAGLLHDIGKSKIPNEILNKAGKLKCFMESVILYPVGSDVMLSTGEMARVVENLSYAVLRPKVLGLQNGKVYDLANDVKCANIIIL